MQSLPPLPSHPPITGGLIVRTDVCHPGPAPSGGAAPQFLLRLVANRITGNNATSGIGGGLLVTNATLAFAQCGAATTDAPGPAGGGVSLRKCWDRVASAGGAGAGAGADALAVAGLPFGNDARDEDASDLASVVAKLVVTCAESLTDAQYTGAQSCAGGGGAGRGGVQAGLGPRAQLAAPPGGVLRVNLAVRDWLGSDITSGFDASLVVQVGAAR